MTWIQFGRLGFLLLVLASLPGCWVYAQSPALNRHGRAKATRQYSSTVYGISFVYPSQFVLKEGDLTGTNEMGRGYPGSLSLAFAQPGGTRIATVEIPAGSYPNTDFVNAFFSVSIHQGLTAAQCAQFAPDQGFPKTKTVEISSITFTGIDDSEGAMGHQFSGKSYHGFNGGRCFELSYGLATAGYGAVDGLKHVDDKAIMARLESILHTVKIAIPVSHTAAGRLRRGEKHTSQLSTPQA